MGKTVKVLALTKYGDKAASTRQRLLQYIPALTSAGFSFELRPLFDNKYLSALNNRSRKSKIRLAAAYIGRIKAMLSARQHDLVWISYECLPYFPGILDGLVAAAGKPILLDFDDATFHQYDAHQNAAIRKLLSKKLHPLLKQCTICICGNEYIAAYASALAPEVRTIPTVVDTDEYTARRQCAGAAEGKLTVGWIGSPTTWPYVEAIAPELIKLQSKENINISIIGAGSTSGPPKSFTYIDWSQEQEIQQVQGFDIGIMPLPDNPWARGKCGFKIIQYMACGIPAVASPVGVNASIIKHGQDGFLARSPETFIHHIRCLIADQHLRSKFGSAGRRKVVERYSLQSQVPHILAAFSDAAP